MSRKRKTGRRVGIGAALMCGVLALEFVPLAPVVNAAEKPPTKPTVIKDEASAPRRPNGKRGWYRTQRTQPVRAIVVVTVDPVDTPADDAGVGAGGSAGIAIKEQGVKRAEVSGSAGLAIKEQGVSKSNKRAVAVEGISVDGSNVDINRGSVNISVRGDDVTINGRVMTSVETPGPDFPWDR